MEDKNIARKPDLEVVLTQYVDGIGKKGEVVKQRPNFAYNNLLLPGLAVYVTPENIEKYKSDSIESENEPKHSSPYAQRTVSILERKIFAIVMNKDHPWVIEPWHIRASLRKCGYMISSDDAIELPAEKIRGPDLTIEGKQFNATVTVNKTEKAIIKCRIHHWSTDPSDRLPFVWKHWRLDAEPLIFKESAQN